MWIENDIFKEDLENLCNVDYIPWEKTKNKSILITGATGLIGYNLVCGLAYANLSKNLNVQIYCLIRNSEKAKEKFQKILSYDFLHFVEGSVEQLPIIENQIDYIIHGASPTASKYFVEKPVETIKTAVCGTMNMLELAQRKKVEGFVYLSSMEVYGAPKTEDKLTEKDLGYIDPLSIRNCYPESKRLCEALIASYVSEYKVNATGVRMAQTFGPGVESSDVRVFAEFARCAIEKKDIILMTDGSSKRPYLYTMDAVSAILVVLLKGESGQVYNVANDKTYSSVKEMAELVARNFTNGAISIKINNNVEASKKYPPTHHYNLDINKIKSLDWVPKYELAEMYQRMMISTWNM